MVRFVHYFWGQMLDKIMRSEAHFAALLFAELRTSAVARERFISVVSRQAELQAGPLEEVFVEPAPFRDGWKALDEGGRRSLLDALIEQVGSRVPAGHFEWMNTSKAKLRSPATWSRPKMDVDAPELRPLYFLFRARADLLVLTANVAAWVELKVESRTPPVRSDSYSQPDTQKDIARFAHLILPELAARKPLNLLIQRRSSHTPGVVSWDQVIDRDAPHWNIRRLFPQNQKLAKIGVNVG